MTTDNQNIELLKNEELYRCFVHQSLDAIALTDEKGNIIEWNKFQEKITGFSSEYVLNRKIWEVQFEMSILEMKKPENLERIEKVFTDFYRTGRGDFLNSEMEMEIITKENQKIIVLQKTFSFKTSNGFLLASVSKDITKLKEFEHELIRAKEKAEESQQKLQLSEEKLRLKLDFILTPQLDIPNLTLTDIIDLNQLQEIQNAFTKATDVASIITDIDGKPIIQASNFSGVCKLIRQSDLGRKNCYKSDKIIGQNSAKLRKPNFEKCYSCGFINAGAPIIIGNQLIAIWMIGQSNIGNVDKTRIANYADEIGVDKEKILLEYEKMNTISLQKFQDITNLLWIFAQELSSFAYNNLLLAKKIEEQKEYEINLLKAKEKAEENDRLKTAFLQNMSHEVRTPLNAIVGFSQLLAKENHSIKKIERFSEVITASSNKLIEIISDVIEISQIHANLITIINSDFDIVQVINELIHELKSKIGSKEIEFIVASDISNTHHFISSDKIKITKILKHLIDNSIKFTEKGQIILEFNLKSDKIEFIVSDTGIGISKNMQQKIFEPFRQIELGVCRNYGGNGLGLAIAKAYIEMLNGSINLESEPNIGTLVSFSIPAIQIYPQNISITNIQKPRFSSNIILIVDDEQSNFEYLVELLSETNAKILHATNGQKAIDICRTEEQIDFVLMDIKMPIMDGYTATKLIKAFRPDLPVIAQTAYALDSDKEKFLDIGFDDYIFKPIQEEVLFSTIDKYVNR